MTQILNQSVFSFLQGSGSFSILLLAYSAALAYRIYSVLSGFFLPLDTSLVYETSIMTGKLTLFYLST
jgi:hypothetical protein